MITTSGKNHILRRNAGIVNSIADTILLGISNAAEGLNDIRLGHEFLRLDVDSIYPNIDTGNIIFKATIPSEVVGVISEVGLLSRSATDIQNNYDRLITSFAQNEFWSTGTLITTGSRAGGTMLRLTGNSNTTVDYDLSYYANEDVFNLALSSSTATTIKIKLGTDASNYYEKSFSLSSGYQVVNSTRGSFSTVGSPNWNNIIYFAIEVTNATVDFDSLRIYKKNIVDTTHVLVSRKVLSTPLTKTAGTERELEYSLKIV